MKKTLLTLMAICTSGLLQINAQITSYPYVENYDGMNTCAATCGAACTLSNGWVNATGDDVDWTVDANGTSSGSTGPLNDHTTGTTGNYLYIEASGCANDIAYLESPVFDLSSAVNPRVSFWYHMFGATINTLTLEIDTSGLGNWEVLVTYNGAQQATQASPWLEASIPLQTYANATNAKFRMTGITGGSFTSDIAIDDFLVESVLSNDAGIISIDILNPISVGLQNVDVTLQNFGALNLTTANIEWSVDGALQTTFPWTGNEAQDSTDAATIGTHNFAAGLTRIKAWTALPNGVLDSANGNDTTEMLFCTPLVGTYTLAASGGDFSTFGELGDVLSDCGVGGDVIVNVAPGTYTDRLILDHVPGASSTATITINGGSADSVTLVNTNFSNIFFDGTDWTTIKNMTLENMGTNDSYGVQFRDSAMNNTIDSCVINMETVATGLNDVIAISASADEANDFAEGQNAYWTTISNNQINGGEMGIHFEGQATNRNVGNRFMNNTMDLVEDYGIYVDDQDSIQITGNTITNLRSAFADGIYMFDLMMFDISYNTVVNAPDYGFYLADGNFDAVPSSRGRVTNNMISSTTDYGMIFDDVNETDIFHNTAANISTFNAAFRVNDIVNVDIRNNIFYSDGDFAFDALDPITTGGNTIDYNNYYTTAASPNLVDDGVTVHADLASWQAAVPAANVNSLEEDPVFVSASDMHVLSPNVNDLGDNSVGILDDVDGDTRPLGTNVDMGADEFTPFTDNAVFEAFLEPTSGICGDSLTDVKVIVRNIGTTITSMNINVDVTGDITANLPYNYAGSLAFNESDTVTVGTFNSYWGLTYHLNGYTDLTGDQDRTNDTLATSVTIKPFEPRGITGYACDGADTAWLSALNLPGVNYAWYDAPTGGTQVGTGDSLLVPSVSTQGTYYVEYQNNSDSLNTTYAAGNGANGNMFDIRALVDVTIQSFDGNLNAGTHATVDVYFKTGSHVGFEANAAAWTLIGTATNVVSTGNGAGTPIPVNVNITIPAGQTYSFYIDASSSVGYTNGSAVGNVFASNAYFEFLEGVGKGANFGATFQPRVWNGTIHFGSDGCSTLRTAVNTAYDTSATAAYTYTLQAVDGIVDFNGSATTHADSVLWDFGDGNTSTSISPSHTYAANASYTACLYAYSNCNIDTLCQTFNVTSVGVEELNNSGTVTVFPNPNKGQFTLDLTNYNQKDLRVVIFNQLGKAVYDRSFNNNEQGQHLIDLSEYSNGVYFIRMASNKEVTTKKIIIQK